MPLAGADAFSHTPADRVRARPLVQERDVLLLRQPNYHPKAPLQRQIEEPLGRDRVRSDRVDAGGCHPREVIGDIWRRRELLSGGATRAEGAVGNAANLQRLLAEVDRFSPNPGANGEAVVGCLAEVGASRTRGVEERSHRVPRRVAWRPLASSGKRPA